MNQNLSRRSGWIIACGVAWLASGPSLLAAEAVAPRFDRDIQPILFGRCVKCHGPDRTEGGLRLDSRDGALAELDSGARAIVPGDPAASVLLARVQAADPAERMPAQGQPLSAQEIDKLRRWIESGSDWPAHWAYRPLIKPPVPETVPTAPAGWSQSEIDRFLLERLTAEGLSPSAPADKRTLLRRVYFDLTGLPPTPAALEAFLADESADAYEKVVDQLLASPRYGERQARYWMDIVHFAETHGHDQDRPRDHAWPYRDYLIRSFNANKPYSRFVAEQVAGDVLFPEDPDAVVATGFLAAGPWDESSLKDINAASIDRIIGQYLDRDDIVTTTMSTFQSATVHCARCHDHKFDPISQAEYYALQAVFAGTDKANRAYDPDPAAIEQRNTLIQRREQIAVQKAAADPALLTAELLAPVTAWEQEVRTAQALWAVVTPTEAKSEGSTLTTQPDGSVLASGTRPDKDTYTFVLQTDLETITGLRLEVLADDSLPHKGPGRQDNGNLHLTEIEVTAAPRDGSAPAAPVALIDPKADFDQDGWEITKALDGNPATAWGIYPQVGKSHRAVFALKEPLRAAGGLTLTVSLKQLHGGGHLIGRPRMSVTAATGDLLRDADALPADVFAVLQVPAAERSDAQRMILTAYLATRQVERALSELPPQQQVYCGTSRFLAIGSFAPAPVPRPVHLLKRGNISSPGEAALPGGLSYIAGLPAQLEIANPQDEGARRAALAQWLTDSRNVVTWRSIANRIWHAHFGRGLVETPSDFGQMGSAPTHPELLDWLAATLLEEDGSLKALHRRIVLSAAYRQSSAHNPAAAAKDADNRLLWRMNRRRLDAESIRDAVLQVSGTLDLTMGGPSVKQFIQSPGVQVTPNVDYVGFNVDDPANHRRSIYRFLFRTLPDPFMETLDCPDGSQLTPQRTESLSALQALALMNDKLMVRLGQRLAERIAAQEPDSAAQVVAAYREILAREPTADEAAKVGAYTAKHGLANTCRILFNSNEFIFVE